MPIPSDSERTRTLAGEPPAPAAGEQELREACAELDRRLRAGEVCDAAALLAARPALAADADAALELIYTEFVVREQLGQRPDAAAWCARFPQWRPQLEELFQVHRAVCAAVGPSATPTVIDAGAAAAPARARRLDNYELRGELGRGGMGVVYQARDLALDRDVAVKLLQNQYLADSAVAGRFINEARITGQLQHPGVPAVYQVGTLPDGLPFLAMKLVRGRTLDELLRERPDPAADRGRFLAVFEQVCQAVGYAHAHRVVHRDLKPANIMVGAFGEVQVMDWGLAKVLAIGGRTPPDGQLGADAPRSQETEIRPTRGADGSTQAGSLLGTPAFMPPEQAIGAVDQIDERSDVFGLGAVLCAVLTGRPPYQGADAESARRLAARAKLGDAHARLEACGAEPELVALCKRCLSPEMADRPADAGAVARAVADLRAAAEERARRAELERAAAEARAAEQRRRRRAQLALAAAVGLLLLGAGAVALWQGQQAAARRARLARNADALADLAGRCEEALRDGDADRAAAALGQIDRRLPEGGEAVADRADQCRADLALLRELDDVDAFWWAPAENKLPDLKVVAGRWREVLAGYAVVPGEGPAEEAGDRVGRSLVRDRLLAALDLWLVADPSPGVRAVLGAADPDPYRDAVRDAVAAGDVARVAELAGRPAALDQPPGFAVAISKHTAVPTERRRAVLEAALRARPGNLALLLVLGDSYPSTQREGVNEQARWFQAAVAAHPRSAAAHYNLGNALKARRDLDGAINHYRKAVGLDPKFAYAHNNLGNALADKQDPDGAIAEYRKAIELAPNHARAHYNLGIALYNKQDLDGAIAEYRKAVELDPNYVWAHHNLGRALEVRGDLDEAAAAYREAIHLDPNYPSAHNSLGNTLKTKGDLRGAAAAYRDAIRLDPKNHAAHYNLGNTLKALEDLDGAITHLREATRLDPEDARAHNNLGVALRVKGKLDEAIAAWKEAVRLDPKHIRAHYNLGSALHEKGKLDGAIDHYSQAISLDPKHILAHYSRGVAREANGDPDGAIAAYRETISLDPKYMQAHYNLGNVLRLRRDVRGAIAAYQDAIRLDPKFGSARHNLAWVLATGPDGVRDGKRAVEHATRACELTGWKEPLHICALAAACAEVGDFEKAVEYQKQALAFPAFEMENGPRARLRLELYAQKKPYRDPALAPPEAKQP